MQIQRHALVVGGDEAVVWFELASIISWPEFIPVTCNRVYPPPPVNDDRVFKLGRLGSVAAPANAGPAFGFKPEITPALSVYTLQFPEPIFSKPPSRTYEGNTRGGQTAA